MADIALKFDPNVPKELHASLRRLFAPYMGVLDRQILTLHVALSDGDDVDGDAGTMPMWRYHWGKVYLKPSFFELDEEEQGQVAAHEIVHVLMDIYANEVRHIVAHLVPEDIREYIAWRLENAEERVVDVIGVALWEMANG